MIGLLVLVAFGAVVFGGFYSWSKKRGLVAPSGPLGVSGPGHVSLFTEVIAYLGTILILAGGIAALGQRWNELTDWGHVGLLVGGAVLFLGVGLAVRRIAEAAARRLVEVTWLLSVACVAGAAGFATHEVYGRSPEVTTLLAGLAASLYAAALWAVRRTALQCLALFAGLLVTSCGAVATLGQGSATAMQFALTLWAFGLLWTFLGWQRYIDPLWVSVPLGVLLALIAPSIGLADHGWLHAIGIVTAAVVMAASVPTRNTVLLGVGAVGVFGYVTSMVVRYFGDSLGVPAALSITGAVILGLAVISARLLRAAKPPSAAPSNRAGMGTRAGDEHRVS